VKTKEPEQQGERRVELRKAAALPLVFVSYHVPATKDADTAALQVLGNVLSSGRSSRLYRRLVDGQLTLNVGAGRGQSLDPGQFTVNMQVRGGVEPAQAEKALYEELEKIAKDGPTPAEMEKARNQLLVSFYRGMSQIAGKANTIGIYEVFYGDYKKLNTAVDDLNKVTAADVKRAAAKYLTQQNRTVATLIPERPAQGGAR
jgi:predicted Zn-dependent peptidase